jgi:Trk K+ transport system NAD-binding subunit
LERISVRVARALVELGERVTIVAELPDPALLREARRIGVRFVEGSTAELTDLREVDLESARCLVLGEDADLRNVQASLAARDRNPGIRVVLRMFNADLADRATKLLTNSRVVSISTEAAPYFAAEALGMDPVPTRLAWGRHLTVDRGNGAAPPSGVELGNGELLYPLEQPGLPARRGSRRLRRLRRAASSFLDPRLAILGSGVTLMVATSVAVFHSATGLYQGAGQPTFQSWIDALVFTATTAYGNTDLHGATWWMKLYAVGFMFAAALGLALTFGLVADVVVSEQILAALSVPRRMRNHVVILGLGNTGYRTALHLLNAGVEVAAAESRENGRFVALARRRGIPVLIAEAHFLDSLRALSVQHARAVVATTSDDLANLEAALAARELNPNVRVITRLFDQDLAERAQHQLRITACQSSSALATPAFVAAALGEGVLSIIEHSGLLWLLAEAHVDPGSESIGLALETLEASGDLRVVAIRDRGHERWRPAQPLPERLSAGDDVLVACSRDAWERLRSLVRAPAGAARV